MMNFLWQWMRKTLLLHRRVSVMFDKPTEKQLWLAVNLAHTGAICRLRFSCILHPAAQMSLKQSMPADVRGYWDYYCTCFPSFDSLSLIICSWLLIVSIS